MPPAGVYDASMTDAHALLASLRAGQAAAPPVTSATPPPATPEEAVRRWAEALGLRPGTHRSPSAVQLAPAVETWCAARGWVVPVSHMRLGRALRGMGLRVVTRARLRGYAVRQQDAEAMWESVRRAHPGGVPDASRPPRYRPRPRAPRGPPPLVVPARRDPRTRLLLDSTLRVWPSAAVAAATLGTVRTAIVNAIRTGGTAAHLRWRYLTPAEVAALPPGARAGDVVHLCWHSPCLGAGLGDVGEVP